LKYRPPRAAVTKLGRPPFRKGDLRWVAAAPLSAVIPTSAELLGALEAPALGRGGAVDLLWQQLPYRDGASRLPRIAPRTARVKLRAGHAARARGDHQGRRAPRCCSWPWGKLSRAIVTRPTTVFAPSTTSIGAALEPRSVLTQPGCAEATAIFLSASDFD
jgi:hypothetical protein